MVVAPIAQAYVDANVREAQLARVRPGQPVTLVSDLYGERVKYHGRVAGISGETGAAFAGPTLLNATAAWFKGPQRSPVRIALDPKELARRPLQVGLSMAADIDIAR
jgi:membrane fusion protein (multidrug efflux system)